MDIALIIKWLGREGGYVLSWWLLVTLAGVAAWPLLFRILGGLPDRGYTLARAAGLMLTGFVFWFLGSLGLLRNTPGGMVFAWGVVLVLGLVALLRWEARPSLRAWFRAHRALIIMTEALFLLLFFGWVIVRIHNPEMHTTEKPMEVMFINSIRASTTFPPHDAWLSGYAISYYYFGYVILAMLADLSSMSTGVAFTLAIALVFSLTGIGAFGVVYNLVRAHSGRKRKRSKRNSIPAAFAAGILGLCFLILMGNLGTALVEVPYQGYTSGLVNADYFDFWDVAEREGTRQIMQEDGTLVQGPVDGDADGVPDWEEDALPFDRWSFQWGLGWRYSRIVHDRDLSGQPIGVQPITEFPNFSFLLADLHPHVLALPFAVLAIGLALNLVLNGRALTRYEYPLYAIWVGGMVFVNSWDMVYLFLLIGAESLRRLMRGGSGVLYLADMRRIVRFAVIMIGLTLVLYAPWLISFTSQANGILPNLIYPTPWPQFFLQFGTFLVILTVFLLVELHRAGARFHSQAGVTLLIGLVILTSLSVILMGWLAWHRADIRGVVYSIMSTTNQRDLVLDVLQRRLIGLPSELLLLGFMMVVVGRLFAQRPRWSVAELALDDREIGPDNVIRARAITYSPATGFVLLLIGAGAVLTLVPDVVYLRDNFAMRINTVFKLYYQGWIMFSIASAFAVWSVLVGGLPGPVSRYMQVGRAVFMTVVVLFFSAGMLYPLFAMRSRTLIDTGRLETKNRRNACLAGENSTDCPELTPLTLNGAPTMVSLNEYAAIQCLAGVEQGGAAILVEAPCHCGYHPEIGRFSALTGIPTLIGWGNHEGQWRGTTLPEVLDTRYENGQRRDRFTDVHELYTTLDWIRAWELIDRYSVDYIVISEAERQMIRDLAKQASDHELDPEQREMLYQQQLHDYTLGLQKFEQVLTPICKAGDAVVYRVAPE